MCSRGPLGFYTDVDQPVLRDVAADGLEAPTDVQRRCRLVRNGTAANVIGQLSVTYDDRQSIHMVTHTF